MLKIIELILVSSVLFGLTACGDSSSSVRITYAVRATVTGLPNGESVVLYNNGGDALSIAENNTLTAFATPLASGGAYAVTVHTSPNTYTCTVGQGSGIVTSDVENVTVTCAATTYTVSTLAGTAGVIGTSDGTGADASFREMRQLAVDASGNIYVGEANGNLVNRVRKISPAGVVTTFAGGLNRGTADGTGADASFNFPYGIAVDALGNVFVADMGSDLIREISPAGVVSTFAGGVRGYQDGTGTDAQFYAPNAIAIDAANNLYVSDSGENTIRKITPARVVSTLAGSYTYGHDDGPGNTASFNNVSGLAVDSSGNVFVADAANNKIRKITPTGVVTTFAGSAAPGASDGLGGAASFNAPRGVAIDAVGNLYVADFNNNSIRLITPSGVVTTIAGSATMGSADGVGSAATFAKPWGIVVDANGDIYVTDRGNYTIRKLTPNH